ncbi:MAG: glycosyltransferase family 87 protein [Ignavibacteria bacterium]
MQNKNRLTGALFAILSLFHFYYGIIPAWTRINSDFPNYYVSSKLLLEGKDLKNIYDDDWFQQKINEYGISELGKFSPFPPPTAFIMIPIASLPPLAAKRAYIIINLIALFFIVYLLKKICGFNFINTCNVVLLSGAALVNNFLFGQFYLIMLLLILLGYISLIKNNETSAGIFWGIDAAVKYFTLIYLPILFFKKSWKTLISLVSSVIFINLAALIFFGMDAYTFFFKNVLLSHFNGELSSQSDYAVQFQSWNSFLRNLFVYDAAENTSPLISSLFLFNFSRVIIYLLFSGAAFLVLYRLKDDRDFIPAAVILLSTLLFVLSPASASYHMLLMILPVILLLKLSRKNIKFSSAIILLFILIGFSPFLINKIGSGDLPLFLKYYRLWLEVILFFISISFLLKLNRKEDYRLINFRSETPKGIPSVKDL